MALALDPTWDRSQALQRLLSSLPAPEEALSNDSADIQARATLAMFIVRALDSHPGQAIGAEPEACPNCGATAPSKRSPYCGCECKEESAFVRQLRNAIMEGTVFDEERQAAFGQKLWHLLGAGYPRRQTLVTEKERVRLFKRKGVCELCGAPATTFDHIGSG